jgi:outer membrane protein assembly factor BamB
VPKSPSCESLDKKDVTMRHIWVRSTMALFAAVLLASSACPGSEAGDTVARALGATRGVLLVVGSGSVDAPGLAAELATRDQVIVHGLALDEAARARSQAAIDEARLQLVAKVERLPAGGIPFPDNFANFIVITDPAAATKAGATREELLRVLVPGGVSLTREGGKWTRSSKPRPEEMDAWTHPHHGPDGNMFSKDKVVKFPVGLRWVDGLPASLTQWTASRGWVVAGDFIFNLSSTELANLNAPTKPYFLVARDAWNGTFLWQRRCGLIYDGQSLNWQNTGPIVADTGAVYSVIENQLAALEPATGRELRKFETQQPAQRLLLADGILVASSWELDKSKAAFDPQSLWAVWVPREGKGALQAFDSTSGRLLWKHDVPAQVVLADGGLVFGLFQAGNPSSERKIVAFDLKTGAERWHVTNADLGGDADLQLGCVARGKLYVFRRKDRKVLALSTENGSKLWAAAGEASPWMIVVGEELWCGTLRLATRDGKETGTIPAIDAKLECTPPSWFNNYYSRSRGCTHFDVSGGAEGTKAKQVYFGGARGACIEGMTPANGALFTAQNGCACAKGQVYGFVSAGPCGTEPAVQEFAATRPTERGPGFGAKLKEAACTDWPQYRHDAERSAATPCNIGAPVRELWKTQLATPPTGHYAAAWATRMGSSLTAPVASRGSVAVCLADGGEVVLLRATDGAIQWRHSLPGRLDSPPAMLGEALAVGCHDGWVYALAAGNGALAWRTRVAPRERRMSAHNMVESVWPATGSVLFMKRRLYATAGRSSGSDGGIAVVALDPTTGASGPAGQIGGKNVSAMADLLRADGEQIGWHELTFDPSTCAPAKRLRLADSAKLSAEVGNAGILDGAWADYSVRRSGGAFRIGKLAANLLAWDATSVAACQGALFDRTKSPAPSASKVQQLEPRWKIPGSSRQVEAVVLAADSAVFAGVDTRTFKSFLLIAARADGKVLQDVALDARPVYDGLAVADGHIYVSLRDGTLRAFGK